MKSRNVSDTGHTYDEQTSIKRGVTCNTDATKEARCFVFKYLYANTFPQTRSLQAKTGNKFIGRSTSVQYIKLKQA